MDVLMCPPTYFDVLEKDEHGNTHMDPANRPDAQKACAEWTRLTDIYRMLGITVHIIDPAPGLVDMTFTANCGFTFRGEVMRTGERGLTYIILSNFRPMRRQGEKRHFDLYFRHTLRYSTINIPDETLYFEGAGDTLLFDDVILMGHGFRTSFKTSLTLQSILKKKVVPLKLRKPTDGKEIPYHLDTAMIIINGSNERTVIAYRGAFTVSSFGILKRIVDERGGRLIEASYEDMASLALNAVVIGREDIAVQKEIPEHSTVLAEHRQHIVSAMNDASADFRGVIVTSDTASAELLRIIRAYGYYPLTTKLSEFYKAGGGAFCLTKILC